MKKLNLKNIRILSLLIIVFSIIGISITFALYSDKTVKSENTFIRIKDTGVLVYENFTGLTKQDVDFAVSSDIPVYVRVKLVFNYLDEKGRVLSYMPYKDIDYEMTINNEWEYRDGYYYYPYPISEGKTPILIEDVHPLKDKYQLSLDILVQTSNSLSFN